MGGAGSHRPGVQAAFSVWGCHTNAGSIWRSVRRSTEKGEGYCLYFSIPRVMYVLSVGLGHSQQEKKTLDGVSHRKMSQGPVRML